jgi:hypothetical protein
LASLKIKRGGKMDKKIWATIIVAVLVVCPVAVACVFSEAGPTVTGYDVVFDPEGDDPAPDGVGGNDPEHPQ